MPTLSKGATVAVTGANGFIGAWVCAELLAQGFQVRAVVRDASDDAKYGFLQLLPGTCSTPVWHSQSMVRGRHHALAVLTTVVRPTAVLTTILATSTRYLHSLPPYSPLSSPYLCHRHTRQVLAAAG